MNLKILDVIEEQVAVTFTGRLNVLSTENHQFLGHLLFKDGEIYQATYKGHKSLKAFYQIIITEFEHNNFDYVVEPEVVSDTERHIHYPYSVLKNKLAEIMKSHKEALKFKPLSNVKIIIDPEFIAGFAPMNGAEFAVLETLTEWSSTDDIYQHCPLQEYEITDALVSLRKKEALKILAKNNA